MTCHCGKVFERRGPQKHCSRRCVRLAFEARFKTRTGMTYGASIWRRRKPTEARSNHAAWVSLTKGVTRYMYNRSPHWVAQIKVTTTIRHHAFSIAKLGESGAKLAASLQRMVWLIEFGVWNPDDADPLALLRFTDVFKGNAEYENSEVTEVSVPWMRDHEN